ncbi:MAG: NAD(P)H-dependent oxidoreductase [Bacteroidetes bacterium]|nr:NAD(P)H-dependent oxidoreductase [Bacteroidota bacterium]
MENKTVIIVGSSRVLGNTNRIANEIASKYNFDLINLSDYTFTYYDYESNNLDDDFLPLIQKIIDKYDTLIFATPVYWYSMSGIMKVFFDRFSDLIRIEKETGRKFRGKKMAVLSNSHDSQIDDEFYLPFIKSAAYLGMNYIGQHHFNADNQLETTKATLAFI